MNQSAKTAQDKVAIKLSAKQVSQLPARPTSLLKIGRVQFKPSAPSPSSSLSSSSSQLLSSTSHSSANDALSVKYRTILEDLLQLKNDLVTKSISAAVKEIVVTDAAHTTSKDWLLVIFKALQRIFEALDVGPIYSNESHLAAVSRLLARLIETSKLLELVESRSETKNFTRFVTRKMSGVLNEVSMEAMYKDAREIFESKRRPSYAQTLELLAKSLTDWPVTPEHTLSEAKLGLWLDHVMPLEFDSDVDIQQNAINAVEMVIPLMIASKHHSHSEWTRYRNVIVSKYVKEIDTIFRKNSPQWYHIWCHCVQILDVEIPRSASTLNAFLGIVEPALRSGIPMRRAEGYLCWRVLLGVLVRHNRLNSEKRLRLACTPLKSLQAKTATIASNKFLAWWYVLCNVVDDSVGYNSMVFEPFLQFCFGPLSGEPNIRSEIVDTTAQVKRFTDVSLMAVATFIRILGEPSAHTNEIFQKFSLDKIDRVICSEKQLEGELGRLVINACGEATFMLTNIDDDSNNNVDCGDLVGQLWRNLLQHVQHDNDHFKLILRNVKQLLVASAKASSNDRKDKTIGLIKTILGILFETVTIPQDNSAVPSLIGLYETIAMLPLEEAKNLLKNISFVPSATVDQLQSTIRNTLFVFFERTLSSDDRKQLNVSNEQFARVKFLVWQRWMNAVQTWWPTGRNELKACEVETKNAFIDTIMGFLFWPLGVLSESAETQLFVQAFRTLAQLILNHIDNKSFCERSAKLVRKAIDESQYCAHITEIVAMLFDYMHYGYKGLHEAPVAILDLCIPLVNLEKKTVSFQDLNPIAQAIIDHYKAISKPQRAIIESKLNEVMALIETTKTDMRIDTKLISGFHEMKSNENVKGTTPQNKKRVIAGSASQPNKINKDKSIDSEFVVVDNVWSLKPNRLTDRQKEKLKERRCDIPALYNNLSQSHDSVSLQEWAPRTLVSTVTAPTTAQASVSKSQDENVASNNTETPTLSSSSSGDGSGQSNDESKSASGTSSIVSKKLKFADDTLVESDEKKKQRVERELSRIHIDAVVETMPFKEGARCTRSSRSLDEAPATRRKLRNETPTSTTKQLPKVIKTPAPAKAKQPKGNATGKTSDEIESQSPPNVQIKRKSKSESDEQKPATPMDVEANEPSAVAAGEHETDSAKDKLEAVPDGNDNLAENHENQSENDETLTQHDDLEHLSLSPVKTHTPSDISHMSPLLLNETSMRVRDTLNESSIVTSPIVDDKKNAEFLNDTLNISPIISKNGAIATNNIDLLKECKVVIDRNACASLTNHSDDETVKTKPDAVADKTEPIQSGRNASESLVQDVPHQHNAPQSKPAQCSTPIQSSQSPISSKFKMHTMGRGAQLLKMINSNKNNQSPTTSTATTSVAETSTILVSTMAMPSSSKLPAPNHNVIMSTPEPANDSSKSMRSELLTFSRTLPSPYESPRFSILKRKASDDDSFHSPAHKRKRVSFNFPLAETVEFIAEDELPPVNVIASPGPTANNVPHREIDAHSIRSPANVKYKIKQKKRVDGIREMAQINHAKTVQSGNDASMPSTSIFIGPNKLFNNTNDDEVSVEHIKEYLERDSTTHREKQKKLNQDNGKVAVSSSVTNNHDDEAASSTPPESPTLDAFSDDDIFKHLFKKYQINDIYNKYEASKPQAIDTSLARFFSRKLSTVMTNDASVKAAVLDELAEKHSKAFLDHAVTENLCSTICNRLSNEGIVDYVTDKINTNQQFAATILDRVNSKSLYNHILSLDVTDTNSLLLDIFGKFDFTLEQFHEFTKLHILKTVAKAQGDGPTQT